MRCDRCGQTLEPSLAEAYEDDMDSGPVEIVCGWCHFGDQAEEAACEERLGK